MAITPSTTNTSINVVNVDNIISADPLYFDDSALTSNVIDNTKTSTTISNYSGISDLLDTKSLTDIISDINAAKNDRYYISNFSIIDGSDTYNYIKYGFEQLSRIRWCKVIYKNPAYNSNSIFNNVPYTCSTENWLLLDSKWYKEKSKKDYVPFDNELSNFVLLECGSGATNDYIDDDKHLDRISEISSNFTNISNTYDIGKICKASSINDLVSNFNRFFLNTDISYNWTQYLSCTFSNVPGYKIQGDYSDDDKNKYTINLHITLRTQQTNNSIVNEVFNFGNNSTLLDDTQFSYLKTGNTITITKYLYDNVVFSLSKLGIIGVKCDEYKIYGWCCVRTNSDDFSVAKEVLLNYITFNNVSDSDIFTFINGKFDNNTNLTANAQSTDDKFEYYSYGSVIGDKNFNNVQTVDIIVNLYKNDRGLNHYWLFPIMKIQTKSTQYQYLSKGTSTNRLRVNNEYRPKTYADTRKDDGKWDLGGGQNGINYYEANIINNPDNFSIPTDGYGDKYYAFKYDTAESKWTMSKNVSDINKEGYYPISSLTQLTLGIDSTITEVSMEDKDFRYTIYLYARTYDKNNSILGTYSIDDDMISSQVRIDGNNNKYIYATTDNIEPRNISNRSSVYSIAFSQSTSGSIPGHRGNTKIVKSRAIVDGIYEQLIKVNAHL
jgi:hypothetical protein